MSVLVLFASQQDCAESVARMVVSEGIGRHLSLSLHCISELGTSVQLKSPSVILLVVASTPDGTLPDTGKRFWRWVQTLSPTTLHGVQYALFGIGDRNFYQYQGGPKLLETALDSKGAKPFIPRGEVDVQQGLTIGIEHWIQGLWRPLVLALDVVTGSTEAVRTLTTVSQLEDSMRIIDCRVLGKRELSEPEAPVSIIELTLDSSGKKYAPGSSVAIYPDNDLALVSEVIARFNFDSNYQIESLSLLPPSLRWRAELPLNLFQCFQSYIEIATPVTKLFAECFCSHVRREEEKEQLKGVVLRCEGAELPEPYSLLHLLRTYSSVDYFPLEETLPLFPPLRPRHYSITSSPLVLSDSFTFVFTVKGVCSRYLHKVSSLDIVHRVISLRVSFLGEDDPIFWKPILDLEHPLLVTVGVGLAPFRGLLEHLTIVKRKEVRVIHVCEQSVKDTSAHNCDLIYAEDVKGFITLLGGKFSVFPRREDETIETRVLDAITTEKEEIRKWAKIAAVCGSFRTNEVKELLQSISPEMMILAEEWD